MKKSEKRDCASYKVAKLEEEGRRCKRQYVKEIKGLAKTRIYRKT